MTLDLWRHACAHVASRYGVTKANPGLHYTLAASVYERIGTGAARADWPGDDYLIRARMRVIKLVEASYPDYPWTKFVRDADDTMWDKALAPMLASYPGKVAESVNEEFLIQGPVRLLGYLSEKNVKIDYDTAKRLWSADREITEKVADCDYGRLYWHESTGAVHWNMGDSASWRKGVTPPEKCPGNWAKGVLEKHGFKQARVEAGWAPKDPGWHRVDRPLRGPLEVQEATAWCDNWGRRFDEAELRTFYEKCKSPAYQIGFTAWKAKHFSMLESYGVATSKSGFEDSVKEPPTAADTAKVDAVVNDKSLPDVADAGKAYVVHWADGRGIFAMRKKADLHPWLKSQGPWAEIISIKHKAPEHGGKPLKVQEQGYSPSNTYDFKLERYHTHAAMLGHLNHVFSGQPHEYEDGHKIHITSRAQALKTRDEVFTHPDPFDVGGVRKASDDHAGITDPKKRSDYAGYMSKTLHDHITKVIDQHFPT